MNVLWKKQWGEGDGCVLGLFAEFGIRPMMVVAATRGSWCPFR